MIDEIPESSQSSTNAQIQELKAMVAQMAVQMKELITQAQAPPQPQPNQRLPLSMVENRDVRVGGAARREGVDGNHDDDLNSIKYKIPEFLGKNDPDAYFAWEEHIERIFDLNNFSERKKVQLAISEFKGYASTWWATLERRRKSFGGEPITTWRYLSQTLRKTFVPPSFQRKLHGELQDLKQGSMSVIDYYHAMETLMLKLNLEEDAEITQHRFLHGLHLSIKQRVELQGFFDLDDLVDKAETIERHLVEISSSTRALPSFTFSHGANRWSNNTSKNHFTPTPNFHNKAAPKPFEKQPEKGTSSTSNSVANSKTVCFKCEDEMDVGGVEKDTSGLSYVDGAPMNATEIDAESLGSEDEDTQPRSMVIVHALNTPPAREGCKEQIIAQAEEKEIAHEPLNSPSKFLFPLYKDPGVLTDLQSCCKHIKVEQLKDQDDLQQPSAFPSNFSTKKKCKSKPSGHYHPHENELHLFGRALKIRGRILSAKWSSSSETKIRGRILFKRVGMIRIFIPHIQEIMSSKVKHTWCTCLKLCDPQQPKLDATS